LLRHSHIGLRKQVYMKFKTRVVCDEVKGFRGRGYRTSKRK